MNFLFNFDTLIYMLYSQDRELEDRIVELLVNSDHTVKSIHKTISPKLSRPVTLRAIYKSVNKLIDANVLIKVGKKVILNREWSQSTQLGLSGKKKLPLLSIDEKIVYTLSSMTHIDTYWKTITSQIHEENKFPVFFYNPHDIWIYIPERRDSEDSYYRSFDKLKQHAFFSVGGTSDADKKFKQKYQSDYLQIDLSKSTYFNRNAHITILGNYIITVTLPKTCATCIDALYNQNESEEVMINKMREIVQTPQEIKIVVENNSNKAKKLRKRLAKNFHIPQNVKKNCKLF